MHSYALPCIAVHCSANNGTFLERFGVLPTHSFEWAALTERMLT